MTRKKNCYMTALNKMDISERKRNNKRNGKIHKIKSRMCRVMLFRGQNAEKLTNED